MKKELKLNCMLECDSRGIKTMVNNITLLPNKEVLNTFILNNQRLPL
jgi:hypothetical protein